MSLERRLALLERAWELGAIIIEDDYDCEFRYEGRPTDCLQSLDRHGLVAYVGTFSKTLLPELRLGYLVAPPGLLKALVSAKQLTDWHTATLTQWALAKFIRDGYLVRAHPLHRRLPPGDPRSRHGGYPAVGRIGENLRGRVVPAGALLLHSASAYRLADGLWLD